MLPIFDKLRPYAETLRLVGTAISIISIVFSVGIFYNKFQSFETNIDEKFKNQEQILNGVTNQLDKRISNVEYLMNNNISTLLSDVQIVRSQLNSQRKLIQGNEILLKRNEVSGHKRDSLTVIRDDN